MNPETEQDKRPLGVILTAILAFLVGLAQVLSGIWLIIEPDTVGGLWQAGFVFFVGALAIVVGFALLQGDRLARIVATVAFVLNVLVGILGVFLVPIGAPWAIGTFGSLLALVAIILLWTGRSSEFFRTA
jgi:hypothetical protein